MLKKLLILTLIFSLTSPTVVAQWDWAISGGSVNTFSRTTDYNNVNHITTDQAGNVYILSQVGGAGLKVAENSLIAYSEYGTYNSLDMVLSSFTSDGNYRWSKVIGGRLYDVGYALKADNSGSLYVTGRIRNVDDNPVGPPNTAVHFDTDTVLPKIPYDTLTWSLIQDTLNQSMFIVRYDTSGVFKWLTMPEPDTTSKFRGNTPINLDVDANGDAYWLCYLLPGEYRWATNNIITQAGTYVVKYSSQGNQIGITRLGLDVAHGDYLTSIWGGLTHFARNPMNGNYYIAGTNKAKQNSYLLIDGDTISSTMYIACFSSSGQLLWKEESGGYDKGAINRLEIDNSGNLFITGFVHNSTSLGGHTYSSPRSHASPYVSAFSSSGNHIWSSMAVVDAASDALDVAVSDTEIAIAGYGSSLYWPSNTDSVKTQANQGYDAFLARFNKSNGELITMERTNTPFGGASYGNAIAAGPQNTYYMGGNFSMSMFLGQDTLYKVGSQRSFFLTKYECDVPEASMSVSGINASNTINLTYTGDPADSVKWYLGDGTQVWGDSIQHSYARKGKYRVCAMAYFECTEVTVCDSLVAGEISLTEESLAEIAIYPNPTNDFLNLENLPKEGHVTIYNLSGNILLQQTFNEESSSLDLSDIPKGVYLLELQNKNGERVFRKVMKE
ncbi:T9SS type A sorting domain-containing protein [Owenweeksia hongkongensis]|uniref:T9SS type A sorting domain-containing protein n=1 Tax=Owenweeksia hongkongensis TaxID=253245 RepID=UPI003A92876F